MGRKLKKSSSEPLYHEDGIAIYCGDSRQLMRSWPFPVERRDIGCVVVDPPWDDPIARMNMAPWSQNLLVFSDPRRLRDALVTYGTDIAWMFTWDTLSPWTTGPSRPLQQTKFCLWYGDVNTYARDAVLWGNRPPDRNHPSTRQMALNGRRLTDLWRESLRWLHHPGAGDGSAGTERFASRQGDAAWRHVKPLGWMKCLLGNCSRGVVLDPFMGAGTTLVAAKYLGRQAIGVDVSKDACEVAIDRLRQGVLPLEAAL